MKLLNTFNKFITEKKANNKTITCSNCGWSWDLKDGGKDPYICHKCNYDNTPLN
jgi:hypothetical protein